MKYKKMKNQELKINKIMIKNQLTANKTLITQTKMSLFNFFVCCNGRFYIFTAYKNFR